MLMKFLSVLLSDDDFCYMGLYFGFLFREVCAQVGPNMGLIWYGYNVKSLMSSTSKRVSWLCRVGRNCGQVPTGCSRPF